MTAADTQLLDIDVDLIVEEDGINPRGALTSDDVAELAASIKDRGVLQPIRVRRNGNDGAFTLVAGKRRLAAARLAGLPTIPSVIAGDGGDKDDALDALIENVQRQDLSPLEEAQALAAVRDRLPAKQRSGRQLAQIVKRSDDWVSDRLRLLTLPDEVAEAIDTGKVGLHAMPALSRLAESGPGGADLATELTSRVAAGEIDRRVLEEPGPLVATVDKMLSPSHTGTNKPPVGAVEVSENGYYGYRFDALPIDDAVKDELRERWEKLPASHDYAYAQDDSGLKRKVAFEGDDADAAKAYGCLLEIESPGYSGSTRTSRYITDSVFIADRVRLWLERAEKEAKGRSKAAKAREEAAAAEKANEDERADREQQERRRRNVDAFAANDDLGRTTAEALRKVKADDRVITLVCYAALQGLGWNRIAASGLRFVDDQLRDVNPTKGTAKYASEERCGERLRELFDAASTPAEVLGVTVRAIVLAQHADDAAKGQSWTYRLPGDDGTGPAAIFPALVDEVAFRAEALTPAAREKALARAQQREQRAKHERERAEREQHEQDRCALEVVVNSGSQKTTPAELAKRLAELYRTGSVLSHGVSYWSAATAKAIVARLEDAKLITLASDGEYYPTEAGISAHEANLKWWRTEGREQDFRAGLIDDYGPLDQLEERYCPEDAEAVREEIEQALVDARAEWAERDAAADKPPVTIVHVEAGRDQPGELLEAELQPDRNPQRPNVRKVIYTGSRTAAWVAVKRITDLPEDDAAAGGTTNEGSSDA